MLPILDTYLVPVYTSWAMWYGSAAAGDAAAVSAYSFEPGIPWACAPLSEPS